MAVGKLVLLSLVLVKVLLVHVMAEKSEVKVNDQPGWVIPREADEPAASPKESSQETREAVAPEIRRLGKHVSDGSVAAGGVIIGGLVTAIFVAVFAYIRVTRKKDDVQVQH